MSTKNVPISFRMIEYCFYFSFQFQFLKYKSQLPHLQSRVLLYMLPLRWLRIYRTIRKLTLKLSRDRMHIWYNTTMFHKQLMHKRLRKTVYEKCHPQVLNRYPENHHQAQPLQYLAATPSSTSSSPGQQHQQVRAMLNSMLKAEWVLCENIFMFFCCCSNFIKVPSQLVPRNTHRQHHNSFK